jgi:hypothetical protein
LWQSKRNPIFQFFFHRFTCSLLLTSFKMLCFTLLLLRDLACSCCEQNPFIADTGDCGPRRALEAKVKPLEGVKIHVKSPGPTMKKEEVEVSISNNDKK